MTDYYQISSSLSISGVNLGIPKASLAEKWEEMATSIKRKSILLGAGEIVGLNYYRLSNYVGVGI